jgi:hypothetical protein
MLSEDIVSEEITNTNDTVVPIPLVSKEKPAAYLYFDVLQKCPGPLTLIIILQFEMIKS